VITIKFRAWHLKEKKMSVVHAIEWAGGGVGQDNLFMKHVDLPVRAYTTKYQGTPQDFVIMQFTGQLDKKGNEIWDSDIILYDRGENWALFSVHIEKGPWLRRRLIEKKGSPHPWEHDRLDITGQVVGNIYEGIK